MTLFIFDVNPFLTSILDETTASPRIAWFIRVQMEETKMVADLEELPLDLAEKTAVVKENA